MKKDAFHWRDKETSARFLALALFLILFPGIAGCTIADMFIATAREVESLGETATDVTVDTMVSTAQAVESLGEIATDVTVDTMVSTAQAVESLGQKVGDASYATGYATGQKIRKVTDEVGEAGYVAGRELREFAIGEKPEIYNGGEPWRMNLVLGGIRQTEEEKEKLKSFSDDNDAIYIPTYYSYGENLIVDENDPDLIKMIKEATNKAKEILDAIDVQTAYSDLPPTYKNGLLNKELQGQEYETIISYSGGTATAIAAILMQDVRCENLILISPMDAVMSAEDYGYIIDAILAAGYVNHIQVIYSPQDRPTDDIIKIDNIPEVGDISISIPPFYEASSFKESDKISIKEVDFTDEELSGRDVHIAMMDYAIANIYDGEFVDPDIIAVEQSAKEIPEKNPPTQLSETKSLVGKDVGIVREISKQAKQSETQEILPTGSDTYSKDREFADDSVLSSISRGLETITQAIPSPQSQSIPKDFQRGDKVETTDLLNVRSVPGLPIDDTEDTRISEPVGKGSTGAILEGPVEVDGFAWWKIQYDDGTIGWSQDKRLELDTRDASFGTTLGATSSSGDLPPQKFGSNSESELGGVNFTSIKLNYISMTTDDTSGVNFDLILKAEKAEGTNPGIDIQKATRLGATAFMTGLAVPDSKLWVNLMPWEPNRIIDEELGQSEVGRIMLEADLQMKRDFSNYTNPCANKTGRALWDLLEKKSEDLKRPCMSKFPGEIKNITNIRFRPVIRHWIISDKIYAYSNGSQIYIINSTLTIKSEPVADHISFEVDHQNIGNLSKECFEELNKSAKEYGEYSKELTDRMVLPYVVANVNYGEKYEDLREVYVALALAQWYKSKMTPHTDIFRDSLDSLGSAVLKSPKIWTPKEIWNSYVYSFNKGEYKCWQNTTLKYKRYSSGGVEFNSIRDHMVKIEVMPPEIVGKIERAISNGFINDGKDVLFSSRLHVDQKEAEERSPSINYKVENADSLAKKALIIANNETKSLENAAANTSQITCPEDWMGPDKNGECWQLQIPN